MLNPNLLQTCKRVAFNQNLLFDKDTYLQRIEFFPALEELRNRDQATQLEIALITAFLTTISNADSTIVQELCFNLVSVVNQDWHKVWTLLCIGSSDTGKSLLANLLTNVFQFLVVLGNNFGVPKVEQEQVPPRQAEFGSAD